MLANMAALYKQKPVVLGAILYFCMPVPSNWFMKAYVILLFGV